VSDSRQTEPPARTQGHGHGWLMIACCIPMLAIAIALVATGVVNPGFLFFAIVCTAMMALMMRAMSGGSSTRGHH
jgi:hypothetical protein